MRYFSIDRILLLIAVIIGFIFTRKNDKNWLKLFPYILLLTLCVEMVGGALALRYINNLLLFNLFSIIDFGFFIYFFKEATVNNNYKKWMKAALYLWPVYFLVNMFFIQGLFTFNTNPFVVGCILLVVLGINYFYRLFDSTEHYDLLREPAFWVSIAVVFYFAATVTITGILNYISTLPPRSRYLLHNILYTINALFYILFIIALLCRQIPRRSSSRS